jgi:hypothetical protein
MSSAFTSFARKLAAHWRAESGQITPSSEFGRFLTKAALDADVTNIVEIGTWNGLGSTQCIQKGLSRSRTRKNFYSIESNAEMYELALQNNKKWPETKFLWGSIVALEDLDDRNLSDDERFWIEGDRASILGAPCVLDQVPDTIDLLLLDGGEFSTWSEFEVLRNRLTKYLFLDDTQVRKNRAVQKWLLTSPDSRFVLAYESTDRNGWSVFIRNE